MAIEVEGPDGNVYEFPDGTSREIMRAAMQKRFPAKPSGPSPAQGSRAAAETQGYKKGGFTGWLKEQADIVAPLARGATANSADEIAAGAGAAGNWLARKAGMDIPERGYNDILRGIRGDQREYAQEHPYMDMAGEIIGSIAPGAGIASGVTRAIPFLAQTPNVARAALTAGVTAAPLGAANKIGAIEGEATPSEYAAEAAQGAAEAAAGGALVGGAGRVVANAVGPWIQRAAEPLRAAGVRLTPGEIMGGYAKRVEDSATSWPFIGQMVRNRQGESVNSLNRAAWDQALEPLGRRYRIPADVPMGREAAQAATDVLDRRYTAVVPRMTAQYDSQLDAAIRQVSANLPQMVRPQFADAIRRHVTDVIDQSTPQGVIPGRGLQHSLEALRDEARRLQTSQNAHAYDYDLGQALNQVRDALVDSARRYTPQRTMTAFDNINRAYRNFAVLRDAASRTGTEQGVFNPSQLHAAVRASDKSAGKGATARGQAAMQDLSDAAKTVMTRRVSDSGTPERAALLGAILQPALAAKGVAAGIAPALLYTRSGNALMRVLATARPQERMMIRNALLQASQLGAPALGYAGAETLMEE